MLSPFESDVVKNTLIFLVLLIFAVSSSSTMYAQSPTTSLRDSTIVFGTIPDPSAQIPPGTFKSAWGVDLLISTNGFGMGSFYRHEYSDDVSGYLDFSISEAKDDNEKEFIDYYGNKFTPGKVNRFLVLPLYAGLQMRLFKDDIMDNFRPYINAAAGPTMIYAFPYKDEYFTALGKGQPKYTLGGYIGLGAFFGSEKSSLLGMNIRYYFIPYPGGLESLENLSPKNQFGGFFITLNFGSAW